LKVIDLLNKFDKIKTRNYFLIAGVAFLLFVVIASVFNVATDLIEIKEIGTQYTSIFWKDFSISYLTMLGIFIVVYSPFRSSFSLTNIYLIVSLRIRSMEPIRTLSTVSGIS